MPRPLAASLVCTPREGRNLLKKSDKTTRKVGPSQCLVSAGQRWTRLYELLLYTEGIVSFTNTYEATGVFKSGLVQFYFTPSSLELINFMV
jgi:hypothetical protein